MAQPSCCKYNCPEGVTNGVSFVHVNNISLAISLISYTLYQNILAVSSTGTFVNKLSTSKDTKMQPDDTFDPICHRYRTVVCTERWMRHGIIFWAYVSRFLYVQYRKKNLNHRRTWNQKFTANMSKTYFF